MSKYNVTNYSVESILGSIVAKDIAIPEIQRPFVWKGAQVRDLIDSLYKGFPTGYLIIWQNPTVKLKDGSSANGKKVLIDGQQRVTALMTAIAGFPVLTDDYEEKTIRIAFNPQAKEDEDFFAVQSPAHINSKEWIEDISILFAPDASPFSILSSYLNDNPEADAKTVENAISKLLTIKAAQLGTIALDADLTIDEVTEIFVRINSKGKILNEADFAMSKIAADERYGGNLLRKAIDYFCHLAVKPDFFNHREFKNDTSFANSEFLNRLAWLKDDHSDIYDPSYADMLRVSFMHIFKKGKLADLVSLLSGRDFKTKTFREEIVEDSFMHLTKGVKNFMNEYNFKQFVLAIENAGFRYSRLLISQNTLDFAYTLFLLLKDFSEIAAEQIKSYVSRWFVMATLTGRYTNSPETQMNKDLRDIEDKGFINLLREIELSRLSETFWNVELPNLLETSSSTSPAFVTYLAALINGGKQTLFKPGITIQSLLNTQGDVHHIFPRAYLKKHGIEERYMYNQVANYAYIDKPLNISIGERAPSDYFSEAFEQCQSGIKRLGDITDEQQLRQNLADNSIPQDIISMTASNYKDFLKERRYLMAQVIKGYYKAL